MTIVAVLGEGEWWTWQTLYNGVVEGMAIGLIAMGVVLIYRSTRVINFAVGNMGLPGSVLLPLLVLNWGVPFWPAVGISLAAGVLFAAAMELVVIRRLFNSPRVVLLIATVGIAALAQAIVQAYPTIRTAGTGYPAVGSASWRGLTALDLRVRVTDLAILLAVPAVALTLGWVFNRTTFGKTVTASAENQELSRLSGVNPRHISTALWAVAGLLATLSMILLSARRGTLSGIENLGHLTLGKALAAAAIARMRSFPGAMAGGIGVGVFSAVIGFRFFEQTGLADFLMLLIVLVVVWAQSRSERTDAIATFTPKVRPVPERLRGIWWVRHLTRLVVGGVLTLLVLMVALDAVTDVVHVRPSRYLVWSVIAAIAICAASVTVLTGWAGQLSLAQMAFAGIGALSAAALNRGATLDVGWGDARLAGTLPPMPFFVAIVVASLLTGAVAALIGVGALRVRGLLLGVSTFMFALACQEYLFRRPIFTAEFASTVPFTRGTLFGVDLSTQRTWFLVSIASVVVVITLLGRLRRSGIGRTTVAARDNPDAASAYTVSPARTKLTAFALAGTVAGFGGSMLAGGIQNVPYSQRLFLVDDSLRLVATAVIGGLSSVAGPVVGALWVEGLPSFFPDNALVPLLVSSIGLLAVLLYFPGGFVQLGYAARDRLLDALDRRLHQRAGSSDPASEALGSPAQPSDPAEPSVAAVARPRSASQSGLPPTILSTRDLTVRFGGLIAVDGVHLDVRRDEIVGLIGTNGAGKSTVMNAIGGFVRSTGHIELLGRSCDDASASERARRGLGRTFQAARLFPELTVLETVQVAVERQHRTPFVATALCFPRAGRTERANRALAAELVGFLGLGRYADTPISELSTGTRRIVELAGLLALGAPMLCLDEPTAGVAQREAEAFGPLLVRIRRELGASMLVIEHDMPLIMAMSDRVYCLEAGRVIAEGAPPDVRRDPRVIASYLGTDDRAIARSDAGITNTGTTNTGITNTGTTSSSAASTSGSHSKSNEEIVT